MIWKRTIYSLQQADNHPEIQIVHNLIDFKEW